MEMCSSETSIDILRNILRYIPEDGTLHTHRCENLKSYIIPYCLQYFRIVVFFSLSRVQFIDSLLLAIENWQIRSTDPKKLVVVLFRLLAAFYGTASVTHSKHTNSRIPLLPTYQRSQLRKGSGKHRSKQLELINMFGCQNAYSISQQEMKPCGCHPKRPDAHSPKSL
jgi:hypothetical protein